MQVTLPARLSTAGSSRFRTAILLVSLLLVSTLLGSQASAQTSKKTDPFRGTWEIETPESGNLIVIVKGRNRASYFPGDSADRTVHQGRWEKEGDTQVNLFWPDGQSHTLTRDRLGFVATLRDSSGRTLYEGNAQRVDPQVLGQWAKPPQRDDESTASERDQAKGFFGDWLVGDGVDSYYVLIESDRSAASSDGNLRGSWKKQGSELHIAWDSGDYSILREVRRGFTYKTIPSGQVIEDDDTKAIAAKRVKRDQIDDPWLADYVAQRETTSDGIVFASRKLARRFYRGDWLIQRESERFEQLTIRRFGGLETSTDRLLSGDWRMQGQDILMRWNDGIRRILSPVGQGFVLYEYKPGRPLDGVPTRVLAAAPADPQKFEVHLKDRKDVAEKMTSFAQAAGVSVDEQPATGWGRSFARWTWPFDSKKKMALSEEKIIRSNDTADDTETEDGSPWWWPFWSEESNSPRTAGDRGSEILTSATSARTDASSRVNEGEDTSVNTRTNGSRANEETTHREETSDQNRPSKIASDIEDKVEEKQKGKRNWVWPF